MATPVVTFGPTKDVALGGKAAGVIVQGVLDKQPPSNKQITVTLDAMAETIARQKTSGPYGLRAARDVQDIILNTKRLLEEKNSNDLLQQLFLHIHQANMEAREAAKKKKVESAANLKADASSKDNKSLSEKAKGKAKEAAAKTKEAATKTKGAASKATTKDKKGKSESKLSASTTEKIQDSEAFKSIKVLLKSIVNNPEFRAILVNAIDIAKGAAQVATDRVQKHNPADLLEPLKNTAQKNLDNVTKNEATGTPAKDNIHEARLIGTDFRSAAQETRTRAESFGKLVKGEFIKDGKLDMTVVDDAKVEQLKQRLTKLGNEILERPDLARALKALLDVLDERWNSVHILDKTQQLQDYMQSTSVSQRASSPHKMLTIGDQIWMDIRLLLAQWTGTKELDKFLVDATEVINVLSQDKEAVKLRRDLRKYLEQAVDKPAVMRTEKYQEKPALFFDRIVDLFMRFKEHDKVNSVLKQARSLLKTIQNDESTVRLQKSWAKLAGDMVLAEDGRINFLVTKEVLNDLSGLMLPLLADQFAMIPLPSITIKHEMIDATITGLTIAGVKLLPEHINIKAKQDINFDLRTTSHVANNVFANITLNIRNMELDLKRVHFIMNKHKGFPKLREEGDVDLYAGGPDTKISIKWQVLADKNKIRFATTKVKIHLDKLDIKFHHLRRHSILLPMAVGLAHGRIKKTIETKAAEAIYQKLNEFNKKMETAVASAQEKLATLPARLENQLRIASERANANRALAEKRMKRARKQFMQYRAKGILVAKGAYEPFINNKGKPLGERAQLAADNVKAHVQPEKTKGKKKAGKATKRTKKATVPTIAVTGDKLSASPSGGRRALEASGSSSISESASVSSSMSEAAATAPPNVVAMPRELPPQLAARQEAERVDREIAQASPNVVALEHSNKVSTKGAELQVAGANSAEYLSAH